MNGRLSPVQVFALYGAHAELRASMPTARPDGTEVRLINRTRYTRSLWKSRTGVEMPEPMWNALRVRLRRIHMDTLEAAIAQFTPADEVAEEAQFYAAEFPHAIGQDGFLSDLSLVEAFDCWRLNRQLQTDLSIGGDTCTSDARAVADRFEFRYDLLDPAMIRTFGGVVGRAMSPIYSKFPAAFVQEVSA
jgi:hypothetical protein